MSGKFDWPSGFNQEINRLSREPKEAAPEFSEPSMTCDKNTDGYHDWEPHTPLRDNSACIACGVKANDVMSGLESATEAATEAAGSAEAVWTVAVKTSHPDYLKEIEHELWQIGGSFAEVKVDRLPEPATDEAPETTLAGHSKKEWQEHLDSLFSIAIPGEDIPFNALLAWTGEPTSEDVRWAEKQISELKAEGAPEVLCVGCEGKPVFPNIPCMACGRGVKAEGAEKALYPGVAARFRKEFGIDHPRQMRKSEITPKRPEPSEGFSGDALCYEADAATAYMDALESRNAELTKELGMLTTELSSTSAALERDRTSLCDPLKAIREAIKRREWLRLGRGSFEWDDDRWRDEFGFAIDEILEAIKPLAKIAADWSNCPKHTAEVDAARIEWKSRAEKAEREVDRLTQNRDQWERNSAAENRRAGDLEVKVSRLEAELAAQKGAESFEEWWKSDHAPSPEGIGSMRHASLKNVKAVVKAWMRVAWAAGRGEIC